MFEFMYVKQFIPFDSRQSFNKCDEMTHFTVNILSNFVNFLFNET